MHTDPPVPVWDRKTAPNQHFYFRWSEGDDLGLPDAWLSLIDESGEAFDLKFGHALSVEWVPAEILLKNKDWESQQFIPNVLYEADFIGSDEVLDKMGFNPDPSGEDMRYDIAGMKQFCLLQDSQLIQVYAESLEILAPESHYNARMYLNMK